MIVVRVDAFQDPLLGCEESWDHVVIDAMQLHRASTRPIMVRPVDMPRLMIRHASVVVSKLQTDQQLWLISIA